MRSTLIILVLVIKFIYCARGGFSENDKLQTIEKNKDLETFETYKPGLPKPDAFPIRKGSVGTTEKQFFVNLVNPYNQVTGSIKEKRCKRARSELYEKLIGNPKKFHKTSIKDIVGAKQKKRCDTCRESIRCKVQGKCDLCSRYCKDVDATTLPPLTEAPLVGSIQVHLDVEKFATEQPPNDVAPFEKSGRYYTVGAFGPGPKQNLVVRLMNVARKNSLDKLVVLAKPNGKLQDENPGHPIIIDTANAFQDKDNNKKIHAEVHSVDGNMLPQAIDLDLTSKIDKELDMAIADKQRNFGKSYLTSKEVDKIIDRVLSMVNSPHQPKDVVEIGSRFKEINTPHITTKRSVSNWSLNKSRKEPSQSELNENLPPQLENDKTEVENKHSNKRTAAKNQNQFLDKIVGTPIAGNNYQGDSYLAKDDFSENVDEIEDADDSSETGEDLLEYEPAPPTYVQEISQPPIKQVYNENEYRNVNPNYPSLAPPSVSRMQAQQKTPNVFSAPITNNQNLESASQHLEKPEEHLSDDSSWDNTKQQLNAPPVEEYPELVDDPDVFDANDDVDVIVTLTQAPETYDTKDTLFNYHEHETNDSDSIVGKSWLSDELDKAKVWWHTNVGMRTPQNFANDAIGSPRINDNQSLQAAESKTGVIDASHFTVVLKNLEQKVENIADLVKKTCGKLHAEDENVGQAEPIFIKQQEKNFSPQSGDTKPRIEPAFARNPIQVINVPDSEANNFETIPTVTKTKNITADPSRNRPHPILDTAMRGLHEGTNFLINKAVDIATQLRDDTFSPKHVENKPLLQAVGQEDVGAANSDHKPFSNEDVTVGCSKEDSEEYVGETLQKTADPLQLRSGFEPEPAFAHVPQKTEENVACSKEESGEYVGVQPEAKGVINEQPQTRAEKEKDTTRPLQDLSKTSNVASPKSNDNENVACSKESEEYVGRSEMKEENVSELPEKKSGLNIFLPKSLHKNLDNIKQDHDSQNIKQAASISPQADEEVGSSKEESEEYVDEQKKENLDKTTLGNEEAVGCSKEEDDEYIVPVYKPYGSNGYRESNSKPKSGLDLPKHKLPHLPTLDELFHRNTLPHLNEGLSRKHHKPILPKPKPSRLFNLNRDQNVPSSVPQSNAPEVFNTDPETNFSKIPSGNQRFDAGPDNSQNIDRNTLPIPSRNHPKTNLAKPSTLFNLNRDHNVPSSVQQSNAPEVFNADPEDNSSKISSDNQRFVAEPENSEFAKNIDQPRRPSFLPINPHRQRAHFNNLEPNQQQQPLDEDYQILSPSNPVSPHSNKVLLPPALNQRFGEQGRVGPDGFHVHRPLNLEDWPQISNSDNVLGAKKELDANDEAESTMNTQNPFSFFGKVIPQQLNNTEVSLHHIPSNKIYFLGTGMHLPLNMKKDDDGSYQLSVDIDKLCNNCKGSVCNKKSNNDEVATSKTNQAAKIVDEAILGMKAPLPSEEIVHYNKIADNNSKPVSEGQNYSEFKIEENYSNAKVPKRLSSHNIETVAMDVPNFPNTQLPTQTKKQTLFGSDNRQGQKIQKNQQLFNTDPDNERKHDKRSPKLELVLPSPMTNGDIVNRRVLNGRKSEAHPRNSIDLDTLDESLKKIDDNMKRYFDRRQKLDDFYKDQVRRNLEQPDDKKDVVKRRVTLVNNVLNWMKNIAVPNPHT